MLILALENKIFATTPGITLSIFNSVIQTFQQTTVIKPAPMPVNTDFWLLLKPHMANNNGTDTIGM